MKLTLALVLLRLIAFQVTDPRNASGMPVIGGGAIRDDLILEITLNNERDTGNASTWSVEATDQPNSSTDVTFLGSDTAGKNFVSNNSTSDKGPAEKKSRPFHDNTEGAMIVFIIAMLIGVIFMSPVINQCRKSYKEMNPAALQPQLDLPPRYQELMQRDDL